jgi:hypothetical protein
MAKTKLENLLLQEIRAHSGCEGIAKVDVISLGDPRFDVNWKIDRICYGAADIVIAGHAAHFAQEKLRSIYLLG